MITIEVKREANESSSSVLRRFSKKVQGANLIRQVKALKSATRQQSHFKQKKSALNRLSRRAEIERLKKLGKLPSAPVKHYR